MMTIQHSNVLDATILTAEFDTILTYHLDLFLATLLDGISMMHTTTTADATGLFEIVCYDGIVPAPDGESRLLESTTQRMRRMSRQTGQLPQGATSNVQLV